jgi:hypothetical protein
MFEQYEKKIHSQQGEDGIIEHIFNVIGTTNKIAVEIGVAAFWEGKKGSECNTLNLANNGWKTFWFDMIDVEIQPKNCTFIKAKLSPENVCDHFVSNNIPTEFDLLSIDIDGNDYHIREALHKYKPRVCIQEYNGAYDGTTEYVMQRNDDYVCNGDTAFGASLKSLELQAHTHGYDLVYCDNRGVNAFFIRKDINPFGGVKSESAWKKLFWA